MTEPGTQRRGSSGDSAASHHRAAPEPRPLRHTVRRIRVAPRWSDALDAGMLVVLALLAFLGLGRTFAGHQYLLVAMVGVALGGLIAYGAYLLRQPVIVLIVVGVIAYFLLGGVLTLRNAPAPAELPTGAALHRLALESVEAWKDLLTTLPPVDGSGPLLVIPYLMGMFVGLGGIALATRCRASFAPVLAPFAAFVGVIVIGTGDVPDLSWRAALFAVATLIWGCVRSNRLHPTVSRGSGRVARFGMAAAALAAAGAVSLALGPSLPGSEAHPRLLLRTYVKPPFNLGNYPSPLAEYQHYVQCDSTTQVRTAGSPLFVVSGNFPKGTEVRFAALDDYDGTVWAASNDGTGTSDPDAFLKVGPTLDLPASGPSSSLTVTIPSADTTGYSDYWMPTAGELQGIAFSGPNSVQDSADFRYDPETGTGLVPGELGPGDSYTLRVADTVPVPLSQADVLNSGASLPSPAGVSLDFVAKAVTDLSTPASSSQSLAERVLALGSTLQQKGKLTDCRNDFEYYLAGHSAGRLNGYVNGLSEGGPDDPPFLGDNEQSAALYALMIEDLGVPARVVVGVAGGQIEPRSTVLSSQVSAWVEVLAADGRTWYTIPASAFNPTARPNNPPQQQPQQVPLSRPIPPPAQGRAKSPFDDSAAANGVAGTAPHAKAAASSSGLPGWVTTAGLWVGAVIVVVALVCAAILATKLIRRRRRRTAGTPADRLVRGWREVVDQARDIGLRSVTGRTRREQARSLAALSLTELAGQADARIFGPVPPTDAVAAEFWNDVEVTRRRLRSGLSRWRRWRAALSLASFGKVKPEPRDA